MMAWAFDLDNTISFAPNVFQSLMSALMARGDRVFVITGKDKPGDVTAKDINDKKVLLAQLQVTAFTDLIVVPIPHDTNKAQAIHDNDIVLLVDDDKANCKAAAKEGCIALLCWNTRSS